MDRSRRLRWFLYAVSGIGVASAAVIPGCLTGEPGPPPDDLGIARSALTPTMNWLQYGGDSVHSSNNKTENGISLSNVSGLTELWTAVGATQPLVANGKVYVINNTGGGIADKASGNKILSYDARTGVAGPESEPIPDGFSGRATFIPTPAIDPGMTAIYASGKDGFIHKYNLPSLTEDTNSWGFGFTRSQFSTKFPTEPAATPLTISNQTGSSDTWLWVGVGDCDSLQSSPDCQGHVKAFSLSPNALKKVFNMVCTSLSPNLIDPGGCASSGGAVWNRAGVVFDPGKLRLYAQTANGTNGTGGVGQGNFTQSVVSLDYSAAGTAQKKPLDSFTPNSGPEDMGGTSVTVLNNVSGSAYPRLLLVGGHGDDHLRLVNADNMSSNPGGPLAGNLGGELSIYPAPGAGGLDYGLVTNLWASTATWVNPADNKTWVFVPLQSGSGSGPSSSAMYGFTVNPSDPNQNNKPSLTLMWKRASSVKCGGGVVANGVLFYHDGTDLLAVNATTGNMSGGTTQAPLWCSAGINGTGCNASMTSSHHKTAPVVANSVVYYATRSGTLKAFGFKPFNPVVSTRGVNQLEVFNTTGAGTVQVRTFNNGWSDWATIPALPPGVTAASAPAAKSWDANRTDIFVRGSDGRLYHEWRNTGGWMSSWEQLDCCISSAPTVSSWGVNRLDIFASQNGSLWHKWYDNGWWGPELLFTNSCTLTSPPAAVSWGVNRIDIVARGVAGDIIQVAWANGWYGPFSLGSTLDSGANPGISTWGPNRLDVFTVSGSQVKLRTYDNGWGNWGDILAPIAKTGVSAVSWGVNRIDVVTGDANGTINQGASNAPPAFGGWWGL